MLVAGAERNKEAPEIQVGFTNINMQPLAFK